MNVNNSVESESRSPALHGGNSRRNSKHLTETAIDHALRSWAQRSGLAEPDLAALRGLPFARRTVERDAFIVREGEEPSSCSLILEGCAFRQKVVRNGSRQIISFHFPGEFIDLQGCLLTVHDHGVQALGACSLAVVPRNAVLALVAERPALARAAWLDTLLEGAVVREWVVNVGRRNARARIAHLLCELAIRLDSSAEDGRVYLLPLTQEHIADATGLTAVHTNRTIQALRRDGLISFAYGRLVVHDWNALRLIGDFSDFYLHRGTGVRQRV
jgi:CRP-like cAMP-binding protein